MGLAVLGGLVFIACAPFLLSLVVSGPAYDTTQGPPVSELRSVSSLDFTTAYLYPPTFSRVFTDIASQPLSNYTVRVSVIGNSSLSVLILDSSNYHSYMSGAPYTAAVSRVVAANQNQSFTYHLDQPTILYLVIIGSSGSHVVQANVVAYCEYYYQKPTSIAILSVTRTILLPAASIIGLIVLIASFYGLTVLAKKAREEAERRQLYMVAPGIGERLG